MSSCQVPPRTLAVWCPDWPVVAAVLSTETAAGTSPRGTSIVDVADTRARAVAVVFANRVVACSAAARVEGVRRGQRRREAQSRVPDLELHPHDPARDARVFEPVVAAVEAVVPGVEVLRPGLAVVAVKGATRYFGSEPRVARVVAAAVRDVGHESWLGVADGSFAAVQAAYSSRSQPAARDAAGAGSRSAVRAVDEAGAPSSALGEPGVGHRPAMRAGSGAGAPSGTIGAGDAHPPLPAGPSIIVPAGAAQASWRRCPCRRSRTTSWPTCSSVSA